MGIRPLRPGISISQEYGTNPGGYNPAGGHTGRDWAAFTGEKLVAIADGVVRWAGWSHDLPGGPNGWAQRWFLSKTFGGIVVVIEHDDVWAIYAHLNRTDLNVGDRVKQGDHIGDSGNTGGASTGSHLHFEILPRNPWYGSSTYGRVHPAPYVTGAYRLNTATSNKIEKIVTSAPRNGIDVSVWQPANTPSLVAADFVIVKATEGTGYVNPHMDAQIKAARAKGKLVGLYHFATAKAGSDAEAAFFLRHAKKYLDQGAVAVLDWEPLGLSHYTQWAEDWMRRVDHDTGKVTVIYMNLSVSALKSWTRFAKAHPLWLAYYGNDQRFNGYATSFSPPKTPGWTLALWQYTQHGRLPGYGGDLDLNRYFGGIAAWDKPTGAATKNVARVSIGPGANPELEEIVAWYKNGRRDYEGWMRRVSREALEDMKEKIQVWIWGYKNPKVNGTADAYRLLTDLANDVKELKERVK